MRRENRAAFASAVAAWVLAAWAAGPLFAAGKLPVPRTVQVGAYINDIQNLDLMSHSYSVDVYLWFRWKDPALDPAVTVEFLNSYEQWGHTRALDHEKPVRLPSGEFYQLIREQGRFSRKFHLNDYPFDRQTLTVEFEDSKLGVSRQRYAADGKGLTVNPQLELPGFEIGPPRMTISPHEYPTDFGDPEVRGKEAFSRVRLEVPIARPVVPYSIKLLLPILCVVFCAALMFLFHPKYVDSRVGIGITALLTIVALQITLNDELPDISYLVLMDKIYLGAYLFVIAGLAVIVKTTWMVDRGDSRRAIHTDRRSLCVLLILYLASMAWVLFSRAYS
ncbi:MAG TPA: hypothetical protein DD417_15455 [Elusimicrobia bacterium]|nr:hypothetical protein [Elusimicrobiota bacterium]